MKKTIRKRKFKILKYLGYYLLLLFLVMILVFVVQRIVIEKYLQASASTSDPDACVPVNKVVLAAPLRGQLTLWPNPDRGRVACGVTSVYMALSYYARKNAYIPSNYLDTGDSASNSAYNRYLKNEALTTKYFQDGTNSIGGVYVINGKLSDNNWLAVKQQIDRGNPVVLYTSLGGGHHHIVLVSGYITNSSGNIATIVINDPMDTSGLRKIAASDLANKLDYQGEGGVIMNKFIFSKFY